MADVNVAIDFCLWQEDKSMAGHVSTVRADRGGATRFGIASKFHPELVKSGFFNEMIVGRTDALAMARLCYTVSYAKPLMLLNLADQQIANAVLSFGINAGIKPAARLLQYAAGVDPDGVVGMKTTTAANASDPRRLLAEFSFAATCYYIELDQPDFIKGWKNRVLDWSVAA